MQIINYLINDELRITVRISSYERAAISAIIGDVCAYTKRLISLRHVLEQLNALIALYASEKQIAKEGCVVVLYSDRDFWRYIKSLCKSKGLNEEACIHHIIEVTTQFIEIIYHSMRISAR